MIYILYHRLICFSSYNTITYSGRQIIKISFSRSQANSSVIKGILFLFPDTLEQAIEAKFLLGRICN